MLNDASGSASPSHVRLASGWKLKSQGAEAVRMALVLICDHELNPSTFAVRVCASTGGSLAAALLAGLATLSGPRHGGAAANTLNALTASLGGNTSRNAFLTANPSLTPYDYGFGHPLYPNGDPRAAALLNLPGSQAAVRRAVEQLAILTGAAPNIDMALAALAKTYALPSDAPFIIFAIGRLVGWVAHAIEQIESRQMIRPRAHFVGVETQGE
ncbi:MAG: citrate/2-methylcitrate synthase [Hyphomicrobiaceae bacterium]